MLSRIIRCLTVSLVFMIVGASVFATPPVIHNDLYKGLSVRYVQVPAAQYFAQVWTVDTGMMTMPCNMASIPHLVEHLVADRNAVAGMWEESTGTELFSRAQTFFAVTEYESTFLGPNWEDGISQAAKVVLAPPVSSPDDFTASLKDVENEYRYRGAGYPSPGHVAAARLSEGRLNSCNIEPLNSATYELLNDYVADTYTPANLSLSLSGPASWGEVRSVLYPVLDGYLVDNALELHESSQIGRFPSDGIESKVPGTGISIPLEWATYIEAQVLYFTLKDMLETKFRDVEQKAYGIPMQIFSDRSVYYLVIPSLPAPLTSNDIVPVLQNVTSEDLVKGMMKAQMRELTFDSTPSEWAERLAFLRDVDLPMVTEWERVQPSEILPLYQDSASRVEVVEGSSDRGLTFKGLREYTHWIIPIALLLSFFGYFFLRKTP